MESNWKFPHSTSSSNVHSIPPPIVSPDDLVPFLASRGLHVHVLRILGTILNVTPLDSASPLMQKIGESYVSAALSRGGGKVATGYVNAVELCLIQIFYYYSLFLKTYMSSDG